MDGTHSRNTVISVRVDDSSLQAIDLLVRAGLAQSRSEAAARFVEIGISSAAELLAHARQVADHLQQLKRDLLAAIRARDIGSARAVLEQDPNVLHGWAREDETPVLMAIYSGANEVTQLLLERGVDLNVYDATAVGEAQRVAQFLEVNPALIGAHNRNGWTLLHMASYFGHLDVVRVLLERGADVAARSINELNHTPLHSALAGRRYDVARYLVANRADVNSRNGHGWTPLHHAAAAGNLEMVACLLDSGARLDAVNTDGLTPAQLARERGYPAVAARLAEERR